MKPVANAFAFVFGLNKQGPNVGPNNIGNGKANDSSLFFANPAFASAGNVIMHIRIGHKAWVGQNIFFYRVAYPLYLRNISRCCFPELHD